MLSGIGLIEWCMVTDTPVDFPAYHTADLMQALTPRIAGGLTATTERGFSRPVSPLLGKVDIVGGI
jgi:hypothetical protein